MDPKKDAGRPLWEMEPFGAFCPAFARCAMASAVPLPALPVTERLWVLGLLVALGIDPGRPRKQQSCAPHPPTLPHVTGTAVALPLDAGALVVEDDDGDGAKRLDGVFCRCAGI